VQLPAVDIWFPLLIVIQMPAEDIQRTRRWLSWNAQQLHMYFLDPASAFAVITVRTGCHDVCPDVLATHVSRSHVIHGQITFALSTILAGIIVPAKHLTASQLDVGARPMNLVLQPND